MVTFRCVLALLLLLADLSLASEAAARPGRNASETHAESSHSRRGKVFSLFSVVTFLNTGCQTTSTLTNGQSTFRNGTCYSSTECSDRSGQAQGTCASGFGVCCLFVVDTASTVTENCTYVQNPSFPTADTATSAALTYQVTRCSADVCQLRLDFESFTLQGTGATTELANGGQCLDTFQVRVTSSPSVIPEICGENMGQHMYVDIGSASGSTATLQFTFDGTTFGRTWDIKVTQVECTNPSAAPDNCLQFFNGLTGRITTFNFNDPNDNHLRAQSYSSCVRTQEGFCCVQYMVCSDASSFTLDVGQATAMTDDGCTTTDFITIGQSAQSCNMPGSGATDVSSRYCGSNLNVLDLALTVPICDCTPPFSVDIFTNMVTDTAGNVANVIQSRGVCLEYMQIPC